MEYLRECQAMGKTPDVGDAEQRSGFSNRQVYRMLDDYNAWAESGWIIGEGPEFPVLTRAEQERVWNTRRGEKEK